MMAVDILPTSIPYDASVHFSHALMPYLRVLVRQHRGEQLESAAEKEAASGLQNAVIAEKGVLASSDHP
jgi:alpha-aminoadipic semialdehyde synthase